MELTVGAIIEGKVKSITNFGAFIALPENRTGLVHISEVANSYVSDIRQHLTEGQDVKVLVISTDNGKINLSLKRLEPKPEPQSRFRDRGDRRENPDRRSGNYDRNRGRTPSVAPAEPKSADQAFEDLLKQFMTESDSKMSSLKQHSEYRPRPRRK